jgi:hypothetical protein
METMLLKDPNTPPSPQNLSLAMGQYYSVFEKLEQQVTGPNYQLQLEWRYYNDGKAWLCKATQKKKTIFWISVWDDCFKVVFYFTEKHLEAIAALPIDESIKDDFASAKPIGKLIPLILHMTPDSQIDDALKVIAFKSSLK